MPIRNLVSIIIVIAVLILGTIRLLSGLDSINNLPSKIVLYVVFLTLGIILVLSAIKKLKR